MANANPYAPPQAHVADRYEDDGRVQLVRTWSAQGRIGRLRYLAHTTAAYILVAVAGAIAGFLAAMLEAPMLANVAVAGIVLIYLVFFVLKTIQRSHDMDWSGWSILLAWIPILNLVWLFKGGTQGSNRFGAPPPPNTLGVKILGLAIPVVAAIGIVAAIALPAYQSYAKRAAAVQSQ